MPIDDITKGLIEESPDEDLDFLDRYPGWRDRDIEKWEIEITDKFNKPQFLLSYNNVQFATYDGFMCITGQAGNGKTAFLSMLVATILHSNRRIGNLRYNQFVNPNPTIAYIDTEQEPGWTQVFMKRVYTLVGWDINTANKRLRVFPLREESDNNDKWRDAIRIIENNRPTVAIIDGLLDMINNPNDYEKCVPLISTCLTMAAKFKTAIWCVIHKNPNPNTKQENLKLSGVLGSQAERKASDIFSTKIDETNHKFKVHHQKSRGVKVKDWAFIIDNSQYDFGIPIQTTIQTATTQKATKQQPTIEERIKELNEKYGKLGIDAGGITATELTDANHLNCKKGLHKGKTKDLQEAINLGVMSYDSWQKKYYYHGIVSKNQPTQTEIQYPTDATPTQTPTPDTLPISNAATEQQTEYDDTLPFQKPDGTGVPF